LRRTPVVRSLVHPVTVRGCDRQLFGIAVVTAMFMFILLMVSGHGFIGLVGGFAAFAGLFNAGKWLTAYDRQLFNTFICRLHRRMQLDPKKHQDRKVAL
jgi:hypothetical protein